MKDLKLKTVGCSTEVLRGLDPTIKHLIFSDCEGFESDLFNLNVIAHLSQSDFIIEVHDFVKPVLVTYWHSGFLPPIRWAFFKVFMIYSELGKLKTKKS